MQLVKKTLKNGNPRGNPNNAPRCLAKTRKGTPCQAPRVRGKKRCRMHGGTNPGRPRDPFVQELKYYRMVIRHTERMCENCTYISYDCFKIHSRNKTPEDFMQRIQKYCVAVREKRFLDIVKPYRA